MTRPLRTLVILAGLLITLTLAGVALQIWRVQGPVHVARVNLLVGLMMISVVVYLLAVRLVLRQALPGRAIWIVLAVAALLRAVLVVPPPMLSSDIYRYVWDGRVQAAGLNPYVYVPADPALRSLRDDAIYPNINRRGYARTIYPPVAQMAYALVGLTRGGLLGMRLMMLGCEAVAIACLIALLAQARLPRAQVLIYAWNPLAFWSFGNDGHVDALAIAFLGAALLLRARGRFAWAGAAVAAATLVKFFPVVTGAALLRGGPFWRPVVAGLVVVLAGYGLYSGAGLHVLGFLPSYGHEEGIDSGGGLWLLAGLGELFALPAMAGRLYLITAALLLALLAVRILRDRSVLEKAWDIQRLGHETGLLAAAGMIAASPHYPWYFAWLALPAVLAPSAWLLWLASAPLLLFIDPIRGDRFLWPALVYVPAAFLLLMERRRVRSTAPPHRPGDLGCPLQAP